MSDQFNTGIQLPNVPAEENARNPQEGYIRLYGKANDLIGRLPDGTEINYASSGQTTTFLNVDGGMANTVFANYVLRLDFGANGASINPTGTP